MCTRFLYCVLIFTSALVDVIGECPCKDPNLCQPISKIYDQEVFIFSVSDSHWPMYDWDKITTIAEVGYHNTSLLCHAHSKGARVVYLANFQPPSQLVNKTARGEWIDAQVKHMRDNYLDGINVDFESAIYANQTDIKEGLTALMQELAAKLRAEFKNPQITMDYAWSPHCIDSRCYDYGAIAAVVDFAFVMSYDERSQIFGPCVAWANSGYNQTSSGVDAYLKLGIPAKKLVLGVPWYGYNYPCEKYTQDHQCYVKQVPFRGVPCSDAAGRQVSYSKIVETLLPMSTTGKMWDKPSQSPYFTYKDPLSDSIHQVWYDDPMSLSLKYSYAKQKGLHGVGMWEADDLNYSSERQTREMWGALP